MLTEADPPESSFTDRQFEKALERIRAMLSDSDKKNESDKDDNKETSEKAKAAA